MLNSQFPQKVLALFGADAKAVGRDFLAGKVYRNHYTLLALDSEAMAELEDANLPYTVVDDWVDPETTVQAHYDARLAERTWFEPAREEFTEQGVCWPEISQYEMRGFWMQSMIALAIGRALRNRGCRGLSFLRSYLPRPAIAWNPSDVAGALWRTRSVEHVREIKSFRLTDAGASAGGIWTRLVRRLRSRLQRVTAFHPDHGRSADLHGKIIMILSYGQKHRYAPAVEQLRRHFPQRVAAVIAGPYPDLARQLSAEWAIPVVSGPSLPVVTLLPQLPLWLNRSRDPLLARRFLRAYETCAVASEGQPWHVALVSLGFHFRYYCAHWWPTLCRRTAPWWHDLFRNQKPAAVMVPAVETAEQILPCMAANEAGVPSFVLPEAAFRTVFFSGLFPHSCLLYDLPLQKTLLEKSGCKPEQMIGVRSILSETQYPSRPTPTFAAEDKLHVLVLTNPTGLPGMLMHMISLKAQYRALQILANPPAHMCRLVELRLKVHPAYHDKGMIAAVSRDLVTQVLPPESDLENILSRTDLVVAVNYHGSALVKCLRAGKPVILLRTERDELLKSPLWCYDMFLRGVTVVRDGVEFWQAVERFRADPHVRSVMAGLSEKFAEERLDQTNLPPLHQVLTEVVGNGLEPPRHR